MKTKNNPEKRQNAIIEYLNKHGKVTTDEIRGILANEENPDKRIPKSTLSEDIKYLKSKGYPIVTSYGYISLDKQETNEEIDYCEKLTPSIIRKWIILYNAVSRYNRIVEEDEEGEITLSLDDLYKACKRTYEQLSDSKNVMSDQMFFRDVRELIRDGYIEYSEKTKAEMEDDRFYSNKNKKIIVPKDFLYFDILSKAYASALYKDMDSNLANVFFKRYKDLLKKRWPDISNSTNDRWIKYYYVRTIPQTAMDMLKRIKALPYRSKALDVTCRSKDGKNTNFYKDFESLDIVYSLERKRLFLRGTCAVDTDKEKRWLLLPLERIDGVQESATDNTVGKTVRYSDTYESAEENDKPDVQKWKNRYEEVYCKEFEEDINGSIPQTE